MQELSMLVILFYLLMNISVHFGNFRPICVKDARLQVNVFSLTLSVHKPEFDQVFTSDNEQIFHNWLIDYELWRAGNEHVQMRKE